MRRIVLDTETTGFKYAEHDRVVEIACVELDDTRLTGNTFQRYVNPRVKVSSGAFGVHGLSDEFLADKPEFADVVEEFLDFIARDEIIGHNYLAFDRHFINKEMRICGRPDIDNANTDTLLVARSRRPGKANSLDALCKAFRIENTRGEHHGALVDAELTAKVYCHLVQTAGNQSLDLEPETHTPPGTVELPPTVVVMATPEEIDLHAAMCAKLGLTVWQRHRHLQKSGGA